MAGSKLKYNDEQCIAAFEAQLRGFSQVAIHEAALDGSLTGKPFDLKAGSVAMLIDKGAKLMGRRPPGTWTPRTRDMTATLADVLQAVRDEVRKETEKESPDMEKLGQAVKVIKDVADTHARLKRGPKITPQDAPAEEKQAAGLLGEIAAEG